MKSWKSLALAAALVSGVGLVAALAPIAYAQARSAKPAVAPQPSVFTFTGGARLGVSVRDLDAEDAKGKTTSGVVIEAVDENSAASKAGFKTGDVVVEFDGERVRSVRQFTRLVSETADGRAVSAAVMRDGQRVTLSVTPESASSRWMTGELLQAVPQALERFERTLPARPLMPARPVTPAPLPPSLETFVWRSGNQLGVTVSELNDQLGEYFGTKDGVLVSSVTADSAAAKAGVKAGDVIVSVNGATIDDASELRRRLADIAEDGEFTLGIVRDKKTMTLKGKIERPTPRRRTTRTIL